MRPDAQSYVRRDADDELYTNLLANEFCHVLTARQMGKSSLMLRTVARLRAAGIGVAALDLTGIGTNLSPEQWYSGLIVQMGDRLGLEDELLDFWQANVSLGPMQRWISAIRKVVLPSRPGRLVIFIDEIDAVASLNFSTDEFFSGIRECYNLRNEDAEMNRLTFCLLGVVNPSDLIRDTRTTPFNVGRRIELNDFTEQEALPLADGLGPSRAENRALLKRVFYWTNGHPYLTQRLCKTISENHSGGIRDIDESIEQTFFSKRAQEYDDNLIFVRERLLRSDADVTALLNLYSRVRRRKKVAADDSQSLVALLRLSGITRAQNGRLCVSNRIYERVFDDQWIKANLPGAEVRRQRAAFRRGVIRTTAVAGVILAIMAVLAITAFRQRNRALQQTAVNNKLLYLARMKVANQEYENANIGRVEQLVEDTAPHAGEEDLRGFEWFLFWRHAHAESLRIQEPGHIASAKFFGGDHTIGVAEIIHTMVQQNREYLLKLFDRRSQKEVMSFSVPAGANFDVAVFSPDNKYVATDSPDKAVAVWDLSSKQQVQKLSGPGSGVSSIVFAPRQQSLAGAFVGGTFRVWDLNSGKQKFEGHSQLTRPGLAFSTDGKLAVGMNETSTEILDGDTGKPLHSVSFPQGSLGLIFFSPDGTRLFATSSDGHIYCWHINDRRLLVFGDGHTNEVLSFSFSEDGKTLATGSVDRTLKLWDVANGRELRTILGHGAWVTSVHFSESGRYLLSGDGNGLIKMWDMETKELPVWPDQKPASVSATAFTPANELIAVGRADNGDLTLWNLSTGRVIANVGSAKAMTSAAFSKDAAILAVAVPHQIRTYSVADGKVISTLAESGVDVLSLQFSPNGAKLLSGDRSGNVVLSDVLSGRTERRLNSRNMYYRAVFSPDGKQIASADQDGPVRIWDAASATISKTLSGHTGLAKLISFSPDGRQLVTAADDNTVRVWDTVSGRELKRLDHSDFVQRFAFSPDGKRLVTASFDGAVVIRDVADLEEVVTLRRQGGVPTSVSFSQDGLILAVSDEKGTVKVWQAGRPGL